MNFYYREMKRIPLLTREEEQELGQRVQAGDKAARETMILSNLRLVVKIANQFSYGAVQVEDLIEEGNIGLMEAVDRFDPDNGARFSTYASWWIKQSIRRAVYKQSRTVRVPINIHDLSKKIDRVAEIMQCESGAEPTIEMIADCVGVAPCRLRRVRTALLPIQSLDAPINFGEDESVLADFIKDEEALPPNEIASNHETLEWLFENLHELPERDQKIIRWRFGLFKTEPLTLGEIGKRLGISSERVRQLQTRALQTLREEYSTLEESHPTNTANAFAETKPLPQAIPA